jgi:hypothetical protein
MNAYETNTTILPGGALSLDHLPFAAGQPVHVRIQVSQTPPPATGQRIFGLHAGAIDIADDFDEPLPDEFWLGEDGADENSP